MRNRSSNNSGYIMIIVACFLPLIMLGIKYSEQLFKLKDAALSKINGDDVTKRCAREAALAIARNWNPGLTLGQQKDAVYKLADNVYNMFPVHNESLIGGTVPGAIMQVSEESSGSNTLGSKGSSASSSSKTTTSTQNVIPLEPKTYKTVSLDPSLKKITYTTVQRFNNKYCVNDYDSTYGHLWNPNYALWRAVDGATASAKRISAFDEIDTEKSEGSALVLAHHDIYQGAVPCYTYTDTLSDTRYSSGNNARVYYQIPAYNSTQSQQGNYGLYNYMPYIGMSLITTNKTSYTKRNTPGKDITVEVSIVNEGKNEKIKVETDDQTGYAIPAQCNVDIVLAVPVNGAACNVDNRDIASDISGSPYYANNINAIPAYAQKTPIYQIGQACKTFVKEHFYHTRGVNMSLIPYSGKLSISPDRATAWTVPFQAFVDTSIDTQLMIGACLYGTSGVKDATLKQSNKSKALVSNINLPTSNTPYYWGSALTGCPIMFRRGNSTKNTTYGNNYIFSGLLLDTNNPMSGDQYKFVRMNLNPCYMGHANLLSMKCERACTHFLPNPYYIIEPTADLVKIYEMCNTLYPIYDPHNVSNFLFLPLEWAMNCFLDWTNDPMTLGTTGKDNSAVLSRMTKLDEKRKRAVILLVNKPDWFEPNEMTYLGFNNDFSEIPTVLSDKIDFSINYSDTAKKYPDDTTYNGTIQGANKILQFQTRSGSILRDTKSGYYSCTGNASGRLLFPRKGLLLLKAKGITITPPTTLSTSYKATNGPLTYEVYSVYADTTTSLNVSHDYKSVWVDESSGWDSCRWYKGTYWAYKSNSGGISYYKLAPKLKNMKLEAYYCNKRYYESWIVLNGQKFWDDWWCCKDKNYNPSVTINGDFSIEYRTSNIYNRWVKVSGTVNNVPKSATIAATPNGETTYFRVAPWGLYVNDQGKAVFNGATKTFTSAQTYSYTNRTGMTVAFDNAYVDQAYYYSYCGLGSKISFTRKGTIGLVVSGNGKLQFMYGVNGTTTYTCSGTQTIILPPSRLTSSYFTFQCTGSLAVKSVSIDGSIQFTNVPNDTIKHSVVDEMTFPVVPSQMNSTTGGNYYIDFNMTGATLVSAEITNRPSDLIAPKTVTYSDIEINPYPKTTDTITWEDTQTINCSSVGLGSSTSSTSMRYTKQYIQNATVQTALTVTNNYGDKYIKEETGYGRDNISQHNGLYFASTKRYNPGKHHGSDAYKSEYKLPSKLQNVNLTLAATYRNEAYRDAWIIFNGDDHYHDWKSSKHTYNDSTTINCRTFYIIYRDDKHCPYYDNTWLCGTLQNYPLSATISSPPNGETIYFTTSAPLGYRLDNKASVTYGGTTQTFTSAQTYTTSSTSITLDNCTISRAYYYFVPEPYESGGQLVCSRKGTITFTVKGSGTLKFTKGVSGTTQYSCSGTKSITISSANMSAITITYTLTKGMAMQSISMCGCVKSKIKSDFILAGWEDMQTITCSSVGLGNSASTKNVTYTKQKTQINTMTSLNVLHNYKSVWVDEGSGGNRFYSGTYWKYDSGNNYKVAPKISGLTAQAKAKTNNMWYSVWMYLNGRKEGLERSSSSTVSSTISGTSFSFYTTDWSHTNLQELKVYGTVNNVPDSAIINAPPNGETIYFKVQPWGLYLNGQGKATFGGTTKSFTSTQTYNTTSTSITLNNATVTQAYYYPIYESGGKVTFSKKGTLVFTVFGAGNLKFTKGVSGTTSYYSSATKTISISASNLTGSELTYTLDKGMSMDSITLINNTSGSYSSTAIVSTDSGGIVQVKRVPASNLLYQSSSGWYYYDFGSNYTPKYAVNITSKAEEVYDVIDFCKDQRAGLNGILSTTLSGNNVCGLFTVKSQSGARISASHRGGLELVVMNAMSENSGTLKMKYGSNTITQTITGETFITIPMSDMKKGSGTTYYMDFDFKNIVFLTAKFVKWEPTFSKPTLPKQSNTIDFSQNSSGKPVYSSSGLAIFGKDTGGTPQTTTKYDSGFGYWYTTGGNNNFYDMKPYAKSDSWVLFEDASDYASLFEVWYGISGTKANRWSNYAPGLLRFFFDAEQNNPSTGFRSYGKHYIISAGFTRPINTVLYYWKYNTMNNTQNTTSYISSTNDFNQTTLKQLTTQACTKLRTAGVRVYVVKYRKQTGYSTLTRNSTNAHKKSTETYGYSEIDSCASQTGGKVYDIGNNTVRLKETLDNIAENIKDWAEYEAAKNVLSKD